MAENSVPGTGVDLEKELTCSICTDVLYQPLTLLDCLHTFCGSCLKEWFSWQATSASHNRRNAKPYSCPSCRAVVRAARPNANVTTLLEMFLTANPSRGKSEVEMEEMRRNYQPGDDVLPPIHRASESDDSEDERVLQGVRELSVADMDPAVAANRRADRSSRPTRSRPRPEGRTNSQQQRDAQREENVSRRRSVVEQAARQQETVGSNLEHQPSLRGLLNASGQNSAEVQEEILHSILSSGMLDGIDIDNMTAEQEEELTERIADAYRRRHRQRDRSRQREPRRSGDNPSRASDSIQESQERRQASNNSTTSTTRARSRSRPPASRARSRPPASRAPLLEQWTQDPVRAHRRGTSATGNQRASSSGTTALAAPILRTPPASRSATDLSERPSTQDAAQDRRRRISTETRRQTDPPRAVNPAPASQTRISDSVQRRQQTPDAIQQPRAARHEGRSSPVLSVPAITCNRCQKPDLQHTLHYHCTTCLNGNFNLCLGCYRAGQGCNHWFGFGYMAAIRWQRNAPAGGWPAGYERPHVLVPRRYSPQTHDGPASKPLEGAFCEECHAFADTAYWHCSVCFEGAWGFCDICVNKGKHCTHPLTPLANSITQRSHNTSAKPTILSLPHLTSTYTLLTPTSTCAICRHPIPPSATRFHCTTCNEGAYDICTDSYHSLVAAGKIASADGPSGRRMCLHGHPLSMTAFHDSHEGISQRIVVSEALDPTDPSSQNPGMANQATSTPYSQPADTQHQGAKCLALWSWFPAPGVDDELAFPKYAEITSVRRINDDYYLGVYAGRKGLFPANHVRML